MVSSHTKYPRWGLLWFGTWGALLLVAACGETAPAATGDASTGLPIADAATDGRPNADGLAQSSGSDMAAIQGDARAANDRGPSTDTGQAGGSDSTAADASLVEETEELLCFHDAPPGARRAPPPPTFGGAVCPQLEVGRNVMLVSGRLREFIIVAPEKQRAGERLPVVFLWHWLGGDADEFIERASVIDAVERYRFVAVVPEGTDDIGLLGASLPWPFLTLVPDFRMSQDLAFFDDMLACLTAQFSINRDCVASAGASAGALFNAQLAGVRSDHLSSFVSISGGVKSAGPSNRFIRDWPVAERKLPALVLWGGPRDRCALLDFDSASLALERRLAGSGHFVVECVHNCGHGELPADEFAAERGSFAPIWEFMLNHPYWLEEGTSPYGVAGLPESFPDWCAVGAGNAQIRQGSCLAPGCQY